MEYENENNISLNIYENKKDEIILTAGEIRTPESTEDSMDCVFEPHNYSTKTLKNLLKRNRYNLDPFNSYLSDHKSTDSFLVGKSSDILRRGIEEIKIKELSESQDIRCLGDNHVFPIPVQEKQLMNKSQEDKIRQPVMNYSENKGYMDPNKIKN